MNTEIEKMICLIHDIDVQCQVLLKSATLKVVIYENVRTDAILVDAQRNLRKRNNYSASPT